MYSKVVQQMGDEDEQKTVTSEITEASDITDAMDDLVNLEITKVQKIWWKFEILEICFTIWKFTTDWKIKKTSQSF